MSSSYCGPLLAQRRSPSFNRWLNLAEKKEISDEDLAKFAKQRMQRENLPSSHLNLDHYRVKYRDLRDALLELITDADHGKHIMNKGAHFNAYFVPSGRLSLIKHKTDDFHMKWNKFVKDVRALTYEEELMITYALIHSNPEKLVDLFMRLSHRYARLQSINKKHKCVELLDNEPERINALMEEVSRLIKASVDPDKSKKLSEKIDTLKSYAAAVRDYVNKNRLGRSQQARVYEALAHDMSLCDRGIDNLKGHAIPYEERKSQSKRSAQQSAAAPSSSAAVPSSSAAARSPPVVLRERPELRKQCHRRRICASVLAYNNLPDNHDITHRDVDVELMQTPPHTSRKSLSDNYAKDVSNCEVYVFSDREMEDAKVRAISQVKVDKSKRTTTQTTASSHSKGTGKQSRLESVKERRGHGHAPRGRR